VSIRDTFVRLWTDERRRRLIFTLTPHRHDDQERAERELARRRARSELARPRRNIDPVLDLAWDRLNSRFNP
jgi:hypothetical protein